MVSIPSSSSWYSYNVIWTVRQTRPCLGLYIWTLHVFTFGEAVTGLNIKTYHLPHLCFHKIARPGPTMGSQDSPTSKERVATIKYQQVTPWYQCCSILTRPILFRFYLTLSEFLSTFFSVNFNHGLPNVKQCLSEYPKNEPLDTAF